MTEDFVHFNLHLSATEEHLIQDVKALFLEAGADTEVWTQESGTGSEKGSYLSGKQTRKDEKVKDLGTAVVWPSEWWSLIVSAP